MFRLGYAMPQWDGLYSFLKKDYADEDLIKLGLVKKSQDGRVYDLFRDRVIFPITDAYGHPLGFGGRRLGEEGPKYINSPETPVYSKGKHIYNLCFAKPYLKSNPQVVVVEGYLDAIQVYQAGFGNVVASLGTAFTEDQARLLKRFSEKVILNFDGDEAGFKAARVSIEVLIKQNIELGIIVLPDKSDPDQYILSHGADAYRQYVQKPTGFFDFLFDYFSKDKDYQTNPP